MRPLRRTQQPPDHVQEASTFGGPIPGSTSKEREIPRKFDLLCFETKLLPSGEGRSGIRVFAAALLLLAVTFGLVVSEVKLRPRFNPFGETGAAGSASSASLLVSPGGSTCRFENSARQQACLSAKLLQCTAASESHRSFLANLETSLSELKHAISRSDAKQTGNSTGSGTGGAGGAGGDGGDAAGDSDDAADGVTAAGAGSASASADASGGSQVLTRVLNGYVERLQQLVDRHKQELDSEEVAGIRAAGEEEQRRLDENGGSSGQDKPSGDGGGSGEDGMGEGTGDARMRSQLQSPQAKGEVVERLLRVWGIVGGLHGYEGNGSKPAEEGLEKDLLQLGLFDSRSSNGSLPVWGQQGARLQHAVMQQALEEVVETEEAEGAEGAEGAGKLGAWPNGIGPFPPWVTGADEDNLPLTRRVQHDLWLHQHPRDCTYAASRVGEPKERTLRRFLLVDGRQIYRQYMGIGAQISWLTGALAEAVRENRIMVITHYERADHGGCAGRDRARWSCYFADETTEECRRRAVELAGNKRAVRQGLVSLSGGHSPKPARFFLYDPPSIWGRPWDYMQRTVEVKGRLIGRTNVDARRWWFAQATRYLMRYPSRRLCLLTNKARHEAFGREVAELAAAALPDGLPEVHLTPAKLAKHRKRYQGLEPVWAEVRGAAVGRRYVAVHVRQGDKSSEMRLLPLAAYVELAEKARRNFPDVSAMWLSTEMEDVVQEASRLLSPRWAVKYTAFPRQGASNVSMQSYEADVGVGPTSDNAFVNLVLAAEADLFVGTLGSTWSVLIDNLRVTGGKEKAGFLSVNKDRYWFSKKVGGEGSKGGG
ncbi:hypothetical protein CLOP_g931 [Closterium sp. NIES-67]|nr:hypothetical protein CLOP_g931 [Closterium sp. NIES-67]